MTLAYTHVDAAGVGDDFRIEICSQWAMSAFATPKNILTSEVFFFARQTFPVKKR